MYDIGHFYGLCDNQNVFALALFCFNIEVFVIVLQLLGKVVNLSASIYLMVV